MAINNYKGGQLLMWKSLTANPIRAFAVLCVAVIAGFIMWMRYRQLNVLAGADWCNRAMNAEKLADGSRLDAALACVGLQKVQISAIATNSYIDGGTLAGCLLVLIVIVIAGGKVSFTASKTGVGANIGKDGDIPSVPVTVVNPPDAPVQTEEAAPKPPVVGVNPKPDYNGPAMPEPK